LEGLQREIIPQSIIVNSDGISYTLQYKIELPIWKPGETKTFKEEFLVSINEAPKPQAQYQAILGKYSAVRKEVSYDRKDEDCIDAAPTEIENLRKAKGTFSLCFSFYWSKVTFLLIRKSYIDRKKRDQQEQANEALARAEAKQKEAQKQAIQKRRREAKKQEANKTPS
jgi:hypothetical protein